ncbi:MAG: TonB-dependent receptor [Muribaculaceae bacterium]|nr:TonB-dependent receptor [Muribaculaceae bacterium]
MKLLYTIILLVAAVLPGHAQISIHGKVTDRDNKPIEFVTVRIAGTAIGTNSGLDGGYKLSVPENDTIRVIFTCIGYREVKRELIEPQGDITLNVKMMSTSHELDAVEVTDFRKQTGQMQSISSDSYKLAGDPTGGSVESLIQTMAGVSQSNELSSQYSVRGGTYDENSVYINGIEVYRPQLVSSGQQEGLSIINPNLVGAIGFSTGGYGAEYGDKMSSVLDITYREPEALEGSASLSLMGGSLAIGTGSKRFSQLHGLRYKTTSSLLGSMDSKGEYDPNFFDYQTSMTLRMSDRWKASLLGNIAINNYRFTPVSRVTSFGLATDAKQFKVFFDGQEKDRFETYFGALSLTYTHSRSKSLTLLASGYLTNELVSYDIQGEYWLDQAGTSGSGDGGEAIGGELGVGRYHEHARNRLKMSVMSIGARGHLGLSNHNISYGLNFSHESVFDRTREWERRDSAGFSLPEVPDRLQLIYSLTSRQDFGSNRVGAFVQDALRLNTDAGYWVLNGGLRFSYWDFNNEFLVSPRVNVAFIPARNNSWTLRGAVGLYYQSPFYKEYRMAVADEFNNATIQLNKNIKSQQSIHFIVGGDYTFRAFNRPFKLSGEAYYKKLNNLIPYEIDNLKLVYTGENLTNGYTMGLDMKLFGQFVPGTDSWISFSLMKTDELLNGVHVPRPTDRRYNLALYFTDYFPRIPRLKFSLRGILSDGLPVTPPRGSRDKGYFRMPSYRRVDIGLSYALIQQPRDGGARTQLQRLVKEAWLGVDVFNLLDITNVSSYYWVTDVNNMQYAVPNYLTRRQINVRLTVDF